MLGDTFVVGRLFHVLGISVLLVAGCATHEPARIAQTPIVCPVICMKSEYEKGCFGGCATPGRITHPVSIDGAEIDAGLWIRGSGPEGTQGADLRFLATVRHWDPRGLAECSFTVDGTKSGKRVEVCDGAVGRVDVTVEPQ